MTWVWRTLKCGMGHSFEKIMEKGSPPPDACPVCDQLVEVLRPAHEPDPEGRSDTVGAPLPRSDRAKAIARFEHTAFVRPHFEDGKPMLTNLRDDVRAGESYVVPETVSSNETMRMTADMIEQQKQQAGRTTEGAHLTTLGGGWGVASAAHLGHVGAGTMLGKPVVDLKSKKARPA